MSNIDQATSDFVRCIKDTMTYQKYICERQKLDQFPDLKERIDEYRQKLYRLQNTEDGDQLYDELDDLEAEGMSLRDNPLVSDFLAAELAFCRLMQGAYTKITAEIDFDITLNNN